MQQIIDFFKPIEFLNASIISISVFLIILRFQLKKKSSLFFRNFWILTLALVTGIDVFILNKVVGLPLLFIVLRKVQFILIFIALIFVIYDYSQLLFKLSKKIFIIIALINITIIGVICFTKLFRYSEIQNSLNVNFIFYFIFAILLIEAFSPYVLYEIYYLKYKKHNIRAFIFLLFSFVVILFGLLDIFELMGVFPFSTTSKTFYGIFIFSIYGTASELIFLKEYYKKLNFVAEHDSLTGALNRKTAIEKLKSKIEEFDKANKEKVFAVILFDLEKFKRINEKSSFFVGNKILQEIYERLKKVLLSKDIICRTGGDEFLIVTESPMICKNKYINNFLTKLTRFPFKFDQIEHNIKINAGVAFYPEHSKSVEKLLIKADRSLQKAKLDYNISYIVYNDLIDKQLNEEQYLIDGLVKVKENLENGNYPEAGMYLVYQPKINREMKIIGVEALLRWNYEGKLIPPDVFIPLVENTGIMLPVGDFVLTESCRQLNEWHQKHGLKINMAVNVSPYQLKDPEFLEKIKIILLYYNIDPKYFEIEITETEIYDITKEIDFNKLLSTLLKMKIKVSIDDFGTGHSSFSRIVELSVTGLKIDKSFVFEVPANKKAVKICKSIISLAHDLNLSVIAEGVETKRHVNFLLKNGCDLLQGYYFSKPIRSDDLIKYVKKNM